jgi:DNA-binding CsgD family transcriptional regulator
LSYALRRLGGADVRVLASRRLTPHRVIPDATVLHLPPMDVGDTWSMLEQQMGLRLSNDTTVALHLAVGGKPMHALAVAADLPEDPLPADVRLPRSLIELVHDRLDGLPVDSRDALLDIAVPGVMRLGHRSLPDPLQPAINAGVVELRRDEVRFSHPLLLQAVLQTARPAALHDARRRAAENETDPARRALHLAGVPSEPDAQRAHEFEEAAAVAARRADVATARTLAARAVQLTPEDAEPSVRWRRTLRVAQAAAAMGRLSEELEDQLDASATSADEVVMGLLVRSQALEGSDKRASLSMAERASSVPGASTRAHAQALHQLVGMRFFRGDSLVELVEQVEPLIATLRSLDRRPSSAGTQPLPSNESAAELLALYACWRRLTGVRADPRLLEVAVALDPDPNPYRDWDCWTGLAQMATWDDQHEHARTLLDRKGQPWLQLQAPDGTFVHDPNALFYLVELEIRLGNLDVAEGHTARLPPDSSHRWHFPKAMIAAWRGDIETCRQEAETGIARSEAVGERVWPLAMRTAMALGLLAVDEPEPAWQIAYPVCDEMHRRGWLEPSVFPVLPVAIEAGARMGRLDESRVLHDRLCHAADSLDSRWARAAADRSAALLTMTAEGPPGDDAFGLAVRSAVAFDALGLRLEAGWSALTAGRAARRAGRRRDARAWLDRAASRFSRDVRGGFAAQAVEEAARLGGRPPSGTTLTPAEQRVAALAARGHSNSQIAAAEYISVKTVEAHLSRIYRKLGVRSRVALVSHYAAPSEARNPQPTNHGPVAPPAG